VQALRAVAIALVVLYHAGVPPFSGGYVGVDIFFVVSGFVITGLLLREREASGGTSIASFYARRARRIIPAATLVIVVTVVAAYRLLGVPTGYGNAIDGIWASIFMANIHFAASATDYFGVQNSPSLLQNFWSLAVEEQFYLVYPTVFLLVAVVPLRTSLRRRMIIVLGVAAVASFAWCVHQTANNQAAAYFSPLTRAWELALGCLVALFARRLARLPAAAAALCTWIGLAAIAAGGVLFSPATPYPGAWVAVPVVGTALVIAGGTAAPAAGVERLLARRPVLWLGAISYSLYLWHWPVLQLVAQEHAESPPSVWDNVGLLVVSVGLAALTYYLYENPLRHARRLVTRRSASLLLGGGLVLVSVVVCASELNVLHPGSPADYYFKDAKNAQPCSLPTAQELADLAAVRDGLPNGPKTPPASSASLLVIGDSTACSLLPGLEAVGNAYHLTVTPAAISGCGVVSDQIAPQFLGGINIVAGTKSCAAAASNAEGAALRVRHYDEVLWFSIWEKNDLQVKGPNGPEVVASGSPAWHSILLQRGRSAIERLSRGGAPVILVQEAPPPGPRSSVTSKQQRAWSGVLSQLAAEFPRRTRLLDLTPLVCGSDPTCPNVVSGITLRPDGVHFTPEASLLVARWLVPKLLSAQAAH